MFTGIIEEVGIITLAQPGKVTITAKNVLRGLAPGASIAVNGVCLTVTSFNASSFSVDITSETLKRTNLERLTTGDEVNLELPLSLGKPLGGHLVQGHIDDTGRVVSILRNDRGTLLRIEAPPNVIRYIVEKGFIAVDGISLTTVAKDTNSFQVSIVDYTQRHTTLSSHFYSFHSRYNY